MKLADLIVQGENTREGIIRTPGKTALVELYEANNIRIPVDGDIKTIRGRGRILEIDHIGGKTTANSGGNGAAEYLVLIDDERLIRSIWRGSVDAIVADPSTAWKNLEGSIFGWRNREACTVQHRLSCALPAVKPELWSAGNRLFDWGWV